MGAKIHAREAPRRRYCIRALSLCGHKAHYRAFEGIRPNCLPRDASASANKKVVYSLQDAERNPHRILIEPPGNESSFVFAFGKTREVEVHDIGEVFDASAEGWEKYWRSGAAIDFSQCSDGRASELERRIVISQYLMKVNSSGSLPPAESGLLKNNWYGKFHLEMLWWHGVHFGMWNRWAELDQMVSVYRKFLHTSLERAKKQGGKGARWPKATGDIDRDWPFMIHAFLVWQQPHPIYFAELDYRLHPNRQTLEKWKDVVWCLPPPTSWLPIRLMMTSRGSTTSALPFSWPPKTQITRQPRIPCLSCRIGNTVCAPQLSGASA